MWNLTQADEHVAEPVNRITIIKVFAQLL